jgi:acetyl esterase/lipase
MSSATATARRIIVERICIHVIVKHMSPVRSLICLAVAFVYSLTTSYGDEPKTYDVRVVKDLVFAKADGVELLLDLHMPEGVEKPPLVMSIHGGAWKTGDRKIFKLAWLVKHGYAVANIEYRMSQEAVFPAQIHDCKGALRWLRAHQKDYGYDASKVVVAGFSAGGYLATLMGSSGGIANLEGTTAGHLDQSSTVQGVIDYFGPVDFIQRSKSQPQITDQPKGIVYQLLGRPVTGNEDFARLASPVTHVGPGDPPILIIHGSVDRQVLPAQSQRLLEVWKAEGLEAQLHIEPGKSHGWSPPMQQEQQLIIEFLAKHLGGA